MISRCTAFDETMSKLGIEQLDLFLIHWPVPSQGKYVEAWKTLVELRQAGRIKSIGVSNFNQDHLERIIGETGVIPAVNQIELHPRFQQRDKREFHASHNIRIESWSPLGSGRLLQDPTIEGIARKHGKSVAQTIIRWHLQEGLIVIPKSVHKERIVSNFDVFDFELDAEDLEDHQRDGFAGRSHRAEPGDSGVLVLTLHCGCEDLRAPEGSSSRPHFNVRPDLRFASFIRPAAGALRRSLRGNRCVAGRLAETFRGAEMLLVRHLRPASPATWDRGRACSAVRVDRD